MPLSIVSKDESRAQTTRGFRATAKDGVGDIYIYDQIGASFWSEGITAASFRDELKALGVIKTLHLYINSPGGDVFEAAAIHAQLIRNRARVIVHVDGLAASAAADIVMAGDERYMASNAMMMIHEPWAGVVGSSTDMRGMADALDKINAQGRREYARATGLDEDKIAEMLAAETWMTADEAVELGFAHDTEPALAIAASIVQGFDLSRYNYHNVPSVQPSSGDIQAMMIRPEHDRRRSAVAAQVLQVRSSGMSNGNGAGAPAKRRTHYAR